ncbi:MAG TPA: PAS domain-containing protein [Steroidobacteraceae bacterium]|nr:PAS domain-containing protein [Steroidobacteraceae bacterium]
MAILDEFGMVVAWYDREGSTSADEVVGKHLTQFYIPTDVASAVPAQHLSAAVSDGSNTRRGWRRHLDGRVYWGITIITPIAARSGRLQGYTHLTTEAQPPWEGPALSSIRSRAESEPRASVGPSNA